MAIRCVAFDLDDTFWDCAAVIKHAEQALYHWLQAHQPTITQHFSLEQLISHRVAYMRSYPELHYDLGLLRTRWLQHLATELELGHDWVGAAFEYFLNARNQVEFFPGVVSTLTALAEEYPLGVITNGNADVRRMEISHLFQFALSSADAGTAKPDPAIFEQALALAGVAAEEMVYVGDDPEKDVIGAAGAGLRTIWYNPLQREPEAGVTPDAVMTNFRELARLIRSL